MRGSSLLLMVATLAGPAAGQPPPAPDESAPAVCGPRCVEFLLHWYGRPTDVSDLIDELQQGKPYQTVSLAAMAEALERRGVHTKAVRLDWGAELDWPHPVVRHSTRSDGGGHFTVLTPPRAGFPRLVWTGDDGYKRALDDRDGVESRIFLLTAPEAIGDLGPHVRRWPPLRLAAVGGMAVVCVGLIGLVFRGRRVAVADDQTRGVRCGG
jgi:hypothetical protein